MQTAILFFLLALGFVAHANTIRSSPWVNQGNLTGYYENQLGSNMHIFCAETAESAILSGYYASAVGKAAGSYPLLGRATSCNNNAQGGFVVSWINKQNGNSLSSTSWSFSVEQDHAGRMHLIAFWIMTSQTDTAGRWAGNNVGLDVFDQIVPPSPSTISQQEQP